MSMHRSPTRTVWALNLSLAPASSHRPSAPGPTSRISVTTRRMDRGLGMRAWPSESTVASTREVALRAIRSWSTSSAATCSPLIRRR